MKLMNPTQFRNRKGEQGITILLVAVCMAFIVMAFAALAIDVTALYTARAEARLAADAGALAGAKVLSLSGMTSDPTNLNLQSAAITLATQVATATAASNLVGGRQLDPSEVTVNFSNSGGLAASFTVNPRVNVTVRRTDLPAFFSKIWGTQFLSVTGAAIAEAYNPSNAGTLAPGSSAPPIAPQCVKPWILPNLDPTTPGSGTTIFNPSTGAIISGGMVGKSVTLNRACPTNGCNTTTSPPPPPDPSNPILYYDGAFAAPNSGTLPASCTLDCPYKKNIAACSPTPVSCDKTSALNLATIDITQSCSNYQSGTGSAVSCLTHSVLGADDITVTGSPVTIPPVFLAGSGNPLVLNSVVNSGDQITTSTSIVTVPVVDVPGPGLWPPPGYQLSVIGFLQVFLSQPIDLSGVNLNVTILNISGCGKAPARTGSPVLGDGVSPVPVRLVQN
jgi:hypothetical protein